MIAEHKIYVWRNISTAASTATAVAIARYLEEAIGIIEEESGIKYDEKVWGDVEVHPLKTYGLFVVGESGKELDSKQNFVTKSKQSGQ